MGAELPAALIVRVTDSGCAAGSGATVTWVVTAGGGIGGACDHRSTDSSGTTSLALDGSVSLAGPISVTATVAGGISGDLRMRQALQPQRRASP